MVISVILKGKKEQQPLFRIKMKEIAPADSEHIQIKVFFESLERFSVDGVNRVIILGKFNLRPLRYSRLRSNTFAKQVFLLF